MLIITILVFFAMLLLLVLVHEWGHFIAARKAGCRVEEFGFGFPPKLFSIKRGETTYSFNLLPIGGFVKIEGENMDDQDSRQPSPTSFASKSAPWRIFILSAGVIMNVVLAAVLLAIQAGIGAPVPVTEENQHLLAEQKSYIVHVSEESPAEEAGLQQYDRIVAIEGIENPTIEQIQQITSEKAGSELVLDINREGRNMTVTATPREDPPEGEGALGIAPVALGLERVSWHQAPWEGIRRTGYMTHAIFTQFGILFEQFRSGQQVGDTFTGPVGIAVYTQEATRMGIPYLLEFAALISINLAIINILPFPALDGGRILFVILEAFVKRSKLNKVEGIVHMAGFALLIGLILLITFKDIQRYF